MMQVLVGGLIALASSYLLDGGLRRRARRTITEELELAARLNATDAELGAAMHAKAVRRASRYTTPIWDRFRHLSLGSKFWYVCGVIAAAAGVAAVVTTAVASGLEDPTQPELSGYATVAAAGAGLASLYLVVEFGLFGLAEAFSRVVFRATKLVMDGTTTVMVRTVGLLDSFILGFQRGAVVVMTGRRRQRRQERKDRNGPS